MRARTSRSVTPVPRWLAAWPGGAVIGVGNGILRQATFAKRLDEATAHQLSAATGVAGFAGFFWLLQSRWPLTTRDEAARVGAAWLLLTVAFEFTFGRLVAKLSWRELLADYNLARGRLWPLVLAWLALGPSVVARAHRP